MPVKAAEPGFTAHLPSCSFCAISLQALLTAGLKTWNTKNPPPVHQAVQSGQSQPAAQLTALTN